MKRKALLSVVSLLATLFATVVASSACMWYFYQPETPESLKDL